VIENYLHHWLHHARAAELRAEADAARLAAHANRANRRPGRCSRRWWRRLLSQLTRTLPPRPDASSTRPHTATVKEHQ
jgi:hypothetical protein